MGGGGVGHVGVLSHDRSVARRTPPAGAVGRGRWRGGPRGRGCPGTRCARRGRRHQHQRELGQVPDLRRGHGRWPTGPGPATRWNAPPPCTSARPSADAHDAGIGGHGVLQVLAEPSGSVPPPARLRARVRPPGAGRGCRASRSPGAPSGTPSTARMAPVACGTVDAGHDGLDRPGTEHHALQQRVGGEAVGAVHTGAGGLARGPQARQGGAPARSVTMPPHWWCAAGATGSRSRPGPGRPGPGPRRCWGSRSEKWSSPVASSHT